MEDVAVVGAGINGVICAYLLRQKGYRVTLYDAKGVAKGGSGAAGAFLSPKFAKGGELKTLINKALDFALAFYTERFPEYIASYPLLHIAKDEKDAAILRFVRQSGALPLLHNPPFTPSMEFIYTSKSAIVDAQKMCDAFAKKIPLVQEKIETLKYHDNHWHLNRTYTAKKLILATGAYSRLLHAPYLQNAVRGIWGHRITIATTTQIPCSLHRFVSISPTRNGISAIGATHNVHFDPNGNEAYDYEAGRAELLEKAALTLKLDGVEVLEDFVGLRSGSSDYIPLLGGVVDEERSLQKYSLPLLKAKKRNYSDLVYHDNVYMINGSAGYGFVLAPYLAHTLVEHITAKHPIPSELDVGRFFLRYVRRRL